MRIPWRGWKDILWRTYEEISDDRLLLVAAGVVFYALLAMFPAITALVSLYGLFAEGEHDQRRISAFIAGMLPGGAYEIISEQIERIAASSDGKLTFAFVARPRLALWSANAGMKAIFDALNIVYDEDEKRSFIRLNLISLSFTLGADRGAAARDRRRRGAAAGAGLSRLRGRAAGRLSAAAALAGAVRRS